MDFNGYIHGIGFKVNSSHIYICAFYKSRFFRFNVKIVYLEHINVNFCTCIDESGHECKLS